MKFSSQLPFPYIKLNHAFIHTQTHPPLHLSSCYVPRGSPQADDSMPKWLSTKQAHYDLLFSLLYWNQYMVYMSIARWPCKKGYKHQSSAIRSCCKQWISLRSRALSRKTTTMSTQHQGQRLWENHIVFNELNNMSFSDRCQVMASGRALIHKTSHSVYM